MINQSTSENNEDPHAVGGEKVAASEHEQTLHSPESLAFPGQVARRPSSFAPPMANKPNVRLSVLMTNVIQSSTKNRGLRTSFAGAGGGGRNSLFVGSAGVGGNPFFASARRASAVVTSSGLGVSAEPADTTGADDTVFPTVVPVAGGPADVLHHAGGGKTQQALLNLQSEQQNILAKQSSLQKFAVEKRQMPRLSIFAEFKGAAGDHRGGLLREAPNLGGNLQHLGGGAGHQPTTSSSTITGVTKNLFATTSTKRKGHPGAGAPAALLDVADVEDYDVLFGPGAALFGGGGPFGGGFTPRARGRHVRTMSVLFREQGGAEGGGQNKVSPAHSIITMKKYLQNSMSRTFKPEIWTSVGIQPPVVHTPGSGLKLARKPGPLTRQLSTRRSDHKGPLGLGGSVIVGGGSVVHEG